MTGEKGEPGADGNVEAKGVKGDQGSRGPPGKHGPKGLVGPMGEKGLRGETGAQGQKGEKGDVGPVGPEGPKGSTGPSGPTGLPGPVGPTGKPGPRGDAGPLGPQGEPGARGMRGWKGDRGEKGKIGETPVLPKSAFTVGLTVLSKFPPSDVPIKFDRILYNEFGHYSVATGKFTCHVAGVYYFTYHITVFSRNVQVSLVKNGVKVLHTKDGYMSSEDQASGGIVLQLKLGDELRATNKEARGDKPSAYSSDSIFQITAWDSDGLTAVLSTWQPSQRSCDSIFIPWENGNFLNYHYKQSTLL
uniref:Complement C1q and tumor necrosis factor-related protein 9 isoform X1 n=1 Tax=Tursiops truncatus TaxID=9739 RepID=A0A6J3QCC5_TURTR|nr:complement C1q and tumor necrosis factor-related protein 9 isoform X1 [Tursiops truncatus]XP_033699743.1 complement C1q and tumor necrosis factor-related protein 9 isoform X1 [Tursiops truncatus]